MSDTTEKKPNWLREECERAKARNALIPPHARMVVTNPVLSAHVRRSSVSERGTA